jgi:hypothetical protein
VASGTSERATRPGSRVGTGGGAAQVGGEGLRARGGCPPPLYWCSSTLVRRPGAKGGTDRRRWLARRAARYDVSGDAARGGY